MLFLGLHAIVKETYNNTNMIERIIHTILLRRHFWRYATFSEVAQLYASRLLRILALHMVNIFIAIFLYNLGFSLVFIFLYLCAYYTLKVPLSFLASLVVARFGPKHATLYANILYIPSLIIFTFVSSPDQVGSWIALGFVAIFQAVSSVTYDYAHLVNFSKIKSVKHGGKELGYMQVVEKIASILSPVIGGLIATLFGSVVVMIVASCLFSVAALPLLRTGEPIERRRIRWQGYPWRTTWRSVIAESGIGFDVITSGVAWTLFLAAVVFAAQSSEIYVTVGILTALGTIVAFVSTFLFGKLIDRKAGGVLIKYGVIFKSLGHLFRPVVGGPVGAATVGAAAEVSTTAYAMAFMRGMFDVADFSGFRLTYLLLIEITVNIGAALACAIAALLFSIFDHSHAFMIFFVVAAGYILLIATPRFTLYRR
jgi:MFS family permease